MNDTRPGHAGIAAQAFPFSARERQRLIEPIMAFYESVNELRDDQKLHLVTLYEYRQALDVLAAAEQRATDAEALAARLHEANRGYYRQEIAVRDATIARLLKMERIGMVGRCRRCELVQLVYGGVCIDCMVNYVIDTERMVQAKERAARAEARDTGMPD